MNLIGCWPDEYDRTLTCSNGACVSPDQEAECERVKTSECKNVFVLPSVESENLKLIKRKYISEIPFIDSLRGHLPLIHGP